MHLKGQSKPVCCRPRSVPFALKEGIEEELDRLEKEGIVHRVMHGEWATPIVPILKPDKKVRICGDFKVTINPALDVDRYPLPKLEELLATVSGRKNGLVNWTLQMHIYNWL